MDATLKERSGIVLLDKAQGITSAKAIAQVKRALQLDKIGHAGTLDPMATGLLVCLTGRTTRLAQYAEEGAKIYSGEILFGTTTDTDDVTGTVINKSESLPSLESVHKELPLFLGAIQQVPPQYSAIKINGERAYDRAREGKEVVLTARTVTVRRFEIEPIFAGNSGMVERVRFVIECSSGTYIRSLARDLGAALQCGGALASLRREASFPYNVRDARRIEEITLSDIKDWGALFPSVPRIEISLDACGKFQRGDQRVIDELKGEGVLGEGVATEKLLLYVSHGENTPRGVLVNNEGRWSLGVNV